MRIRLGLLALIVLAGMCVPNVAEAENRWRTTIYEPDGTPLDTWVFRPNGLGPDDRTPVIVSVTQTLKSGGDILAPNPLGTLDPHASTAGGYTQVLVSASGFGASGGCADWGGPRDRAAVHTAVEWAADQPWSTGDVGLIGSSYDGMTAALGLASRPKGLRAVVDIHGASGYNEIFSYRVRNMLTGHGLPAAIAVGNDVLPASVNEDPERQLRGPVSHYRHPACMADTAAAPLHEDPNSRFWRERDIAVMAKGTRIPTLYMQGFIDYNVRPSAFTPIWRSLAGPKRAILGSWTHAMWPSGDITFGDDVTNWFARYLKHEKVPDLAPVVVADQSNRARRETTWPPDDAVVRPLRLRAGAYTDGPGNAGEAEPADLVRDTFPVDFTNAIPSGAGIWTFTRPLPYEVRMSGDPKLTATVAPLVPDVHLVGLVYDVDPSGVAALVTRGVMKVLGPGTHSFEMYPTDWRFDPGNRIGILVTGGDDWWFEPGLSNTPVMVTSAVLQAPFLRYERVTDESPRWRSNPRPKPITVDPSTYQTATTNDPLPPKLRPARH